MKTFVGVDYHKAYSYGTIMKQSGEILKQGCFGNHPEALARFLGEHAGPDCAAVLEATRNWCVMHDWLEELTGQVTLAHPLKVKAIAEAKIKTDKIAATTLAHLLRCDLVPAVYVWSPAARILKNPLRHRIFLVRLQTMTKNRIHVLLDRHPLIRAQRRAAELFTKSGIACCGRSGCRPTTATSSTAKWICSSTCRPRSSRSTPGCGRWVAKTGASS